ncbi:hypothetical protein BaRGS_00034746 [Batillaria attramentaria]|uniref:C2H2-type domain-containing protein n=1 Tax=Batillaria attramentaria TaxID=370345 RepID=A0ABD0JGS3_9CAEN
MERLTTNCGPTEGHSTCLTLCYQSLTGNVTQMAVDNQPSVVASQIGVEGHVAGPISHIAVDSHGHGSMAQIGIDGQTVGVDSQAAVAVQSLLESQQTQETTVEDEDVFQCGRCKKQFTSLNAFFTHKQTHCLPSSGPVQQVQQLTQVQGGNMRAPLQTALSSSGAGSFANSICTVTQPLTTYTTLPASPLSQLPQGVVLADDLMTLTSLDPSTLQGSTIQMVCNTVAAPYNPRSTGGVTILSAVQPTATLATGAATYPQQTTPTQLTPLTPQHSGVASSQLASFAAQSSMTGTLTSFSQQPVHTVSVQQQPPQPITITLPETKTPNIIRRNPTKAGRKSSQSQAAGGVVVVEDGSIELTGTRRGGRGIAVAEDKRRSLQCQYCNKLFAKNFDLQQHVRAHTGEKPFQCIVCGRAFAQKSNVKKHMATHKVWPSGTSSTLPKQPPPEPVMEGEENSSSVGGEEEAVEAAGGVMMTVGEQQAVVKEEPDLDKEEKVSALNAVQNGQVKVRVVVDNSYICQYCSEKFKTFFQLKTHMVKHKSEQVYKCVMKDCGAAFAELDAFLDHTKTHENEMTYRCHQCNKYFPSLYDLGVHQYTHSLYPSQGLKSGPRHFQCTKCGNKYTTPEALEHHLATTTHQYPCPHCPKVFSCERFLRRHLPIHGSEGQFECATCNKRFKTEHYLKSHSLIHTGETPYQCEVCQAAFNRKDKLKRHMTIHEAVKKYRCPFKSLTGCMKEFNRPDKLKSHIITHSGIKPFKCSVCGKGFSRRPHLMEHERGHNADYRYKCEKCGKGFFRAKLYNEHKCQPGKAGLEPQLFRPRNRRKIGRPRKRLVPVTLVDGITEVTSSVRSSSRSTRGKPGLRSASGIHLRNARVAAAIASQQKGSSRSRASVSMAPSVQSGSIEPDDKEDDVIQGEITAAQVEPVSLNDIQLVQQVSLPAADLDGQVIDHYVVHLTECSDGGVPTLHTTLTPATLQAGLAAGTLQPITIIEATPMQVGGTRGMTDASGLPMVGVSRGGEVVATQVVVASASPGSQQQQTFVTCPAQLVDFGAGDPVLQGTESLLKASAEILQTAQSETQP